MDKPSFVGIWLLLGALYFLAAYYVYSVVGQALKLIFT